MTIELFTLCDGAYNYNGKLTIVGSLTSVSVGELPAKLQMSIAMRIRVEAEEKGNCQLKIQFVNPDGTVIPADLVINTELDSSEKISYLAIAATIQGLRIEQAGNHVVRVTIGDNIVGEYPFDIIKK